ncbi:hypothetical protein DNTS_021006, partial [Danionella cerebrum]
VASLKLPSRRNLTLCYEQLFAYIACIRIQFTKNSNMSETADENAGVKPQKSGGKDHKKLTSEALRGAIQLGIGYTVGNLTSKPDRDVLMQDFYMVESVFLPSEGSNLTPAHHYPDFRFKNYAPLAFRYFRELFGIKPDDYLVKHLDDEFIIKTVQNKEAEFLQKLLPGYY